MNENEIVQEEQVEEELSLEEILSREIDKGSDDGEQDVSDEELLNTDDAQAEKAEGDETPIDPEVVEDAKVEEVVIPQETQEYIAQLEGEKQISDTFRSIVEPHFDFLESIGSNPFVHAQELFQLSRALHTADDAGKASILADLFVSFGVSADAIEAALNERLTRPAPDPVLQKLDRLEQQLAQKNQPAPQAPQAPQPSPEMVKQVQEFSSKHEFFETVKQDMGVLLQNGRAANLKEAYTLACRMNDQVQATLRERGKTAAQASRQSVKSTSTAPKSTSSSSDLHSILSQAYDESE